MHRFPLYLAILFLPLGLLSGCGINSGNNGSGSGSVNAIVTMRDTPANADVLAFSITVSSVVLVGQSGTSNATLLSSPVTVQMQNLLTQSVLLADISIPAGTYSGATVTFSSPNFTIQNTGGTTLNLPGSKTCLTAAVCTVTSTLNQVSSTSSSSPFPLTLTAGTPVNLNIDLNVAKSIQSDFTVTPSVTVSTPATASNGNLTNLSVTGQITSAGSNTFTVTNAITGQPVVITTNSSTTYSNFAQGTTSGCTTANTATCVAQNQNVTVNYGVSATSTSTNTATGVTLQNAITNAVTGTVIAANPSANQFTMVVTGTSPNVTGTIGQQLIVTVPTTSSSFNVQSGGLTIPSGLSFNGASNIAVGQTIAVNSTTTSINNGSITANQVLLLPTQFAGTLNGVNGANLTVSGLNGMFGSTTTSLTVDTSSNTTFSGVTGLAGLTTGGNVAVSGLVYNTSSGYQVVGGTITNGT